MFRKKIFSVVIPIIIGMCISVIPCQENMAEETSNKSVSVQSSGEPSGDAQVISEKTEDIDEIELYAVGEKDISQTEFIKSLLSKVGKGYSQSKRRKLLRLQFTCHEMSSGIWLNWDSDFNSRLEQQIGWNKYWRYHYISR